MSESYVKQSLIKITGPSTKHETSSLIEITISMSPSPFSSSCSSNCLNLVIVISETTLLISILVLLVFSVYQGTLFNKLLLVGLSPGPMAFLYVSIP